MRFRSALFLLLGMLAATGCSTLDKEQCLSADWHAIGFEDGREGYADGRLALHREACADWRVEPDRSAYRSGHQQGIRAYCQPQNGYHLGLRAGYYGGFCPADLERDFVEAYDYGKSIYYLERELHGVERRLDEVYGTLRVVEREIDDKKQKLNSADTRPALIIEIENLAFKKQELQSRLRTLQNNSSELASNIRQLQHQSPYR